MFFIVYIISLYLKAITDIMMENNKEIIKISDLFMVVNKKIRGIVPETDERNNLGRLVNLFSKRLVPINTQ